MCVSDADFKHEASEDYLARLKNPLVPNWAMCCAEPQRSVSRSRMRDASLRLSMTQTLVLSFENLAGEDARWSAWRAARPQSRDLERVDNLAVLGDHTLGIVEESRFGLVEHSPAENIRPAAGSARSETGFRVAIISTLCGIRYHL